MQLIGKSMIAHYIKQHPELKYYFLKWLKGFSELEERRCLSILSTYKSMKMKESDWKFGIAEWNLSYDTNCQICVNTNIWLKTSCILWIGATDELENCIEELQKGIIRSQYVNKNERGLNRAAAIFEALPKTPEHIELQKLVKSIKMYEDNFIQLPG